MTISKRRGAAIGAAVAAALAGVAAPAAAQNVLLEEISVTAQRREQALQDVPIAVTAYNEEQLRRLQVTEALDMTRLVPNMIGQNNTGLGTANVYSIRGLNNTESIATFDPPVGTYVDDIFVQRQNANNFALFDIDRVEVLRGPQGTLFGRNTTGGAVRFILKKPAEELGGYAEVSYGAFDRITGRGSIDIPVADNFRTKLSAYYIEDDGWVDNLTTGETLNSQESFGVRAAAIWDITDAVSWELAVDYTEDDQANQINNPDGSSRVAFSSLSQEGTPLAGVAGLTGAKRFFAQGNEVETLSFTSDLTWTTDAGTLNFIVGWRDLSQEFALDFLQIPVGPAGAFVIANDGEHEQLSGEIKWNSSLGDRIDYTAGIFYFEEDNVTDFADIVFGNLSADRRLDNTTEALAFYLQGDYRLTDRWTFTAGVRYTDEDKDIALTDNAPAGNATDLTSANIAAQGIPLALNTQLWTPRFAVQYAASDELNFFASATRGFKSGGWNARGNAPINFQPFSEEVVWSYEAGMRSEWFDNRLRANLTLFWTDASGFQIPSAFEDPNTGAPIFITQNFADLENKGVEIELLANPIADLTIIVAAGFQDAEYTNLAPELAAQQAQCQQGLASNDPGLIADNCNRGIVTVDGAIADPTRAPEYSLTLGANYVWRLGGSYELIPSAYMYTLGEHNISTEQVIIDGYTMYNASLELNNLDQGWSVTAECKNCSNRAMPVSVLAAQTYFQDPRTWSINFRKDFGGYR